MPSLDLLTLARGNITAPAGCGKTQLIADSLQRCADAKPALVLTHTNAGKAALEQRLEQAEVPKAAYRVFTIDSWAIRLVKRFPIRSGLNLKVADLENPKSDYPALRAAAAALLESGHIEDPLRSTYSRLLVDEYQDCGLDQHRMVVAASKALPTVVLGDPLQAIFGFSGPTVDWARHVDPDFPPAGTLDTPWRWRRAGAEPLGAWLLNIRPALLAGQPVDLRLAPAQVVWITIAGDANTQHTQRMQAARTKAPNKEGSVLVIGDSTNPASQRNIAHCTPGAICVEAVDFKDLTAFGRTFNPKLPGALTALVHFASDLMTNLAPGTLLKRVEVLARGTSRTPATPLEQAGLWFHQTPTLGQAAATLKLLADGPQVRVYRPQVLRMLVSALNSAQGGTLGLYEAVVRERERQRHLSHHLPRRAVGSTLLLKGLEADVAVVLYPEKMDGRNLYVAMTRGARGLVVCSNGPLLTPLGNQARRSS